MQKLICPFCKIAYDLSKRIPRLFKSCGHSFCTSCIIQLLEENTNQVMCPEDGEVYNIQKNKQPLQNFPKNIAIINLLSQEHIKDDEEDQQYQNCNFHKKPNNLICITDYTRICTDCALFGDHQNHEILKKESFLQDFEQQLQELKKIYKKESLRNISLKQNNKLNETQNKFQNTFQESQEIIKNKFDIQIKQLERQKEQELIQCHEFFQNIEQNIQKVKNSLQDFTNKEHQIKTTFKKLEKQKNKSNPQLDTIIDTMYKDEKLKNLIKNFNSKSFDQIAIQISKINQEITLYPPIEKPQFDKKQLQEKDNNKDQNLIDALNDVEKQISEFSLTLEEEPDQEIQESPIQIKQPPKKYTSYRKSQIISQKEIFNLPQMSRINSPKRKKSFIRDRSAILTRENDLLMQSEVQPKKNDQSRISINFRDNKSQSIQQKRKSQIFKTKPKKNSINFENHNIQDRDIQQIIIRIRQNQNATLLQLNNNKITDKGFIQLLNFLTKHENLQELEIRQNLISELGLKKLHQNFHKLKKIKTIDLRNNQIHEKQENNQVRNAMWIRGINLKFQLINNVITFIQSQQDDHKKCFYDSLKDKWQD